MSGWFIYGLILVGFNALLFFLHMFVTNNMTGVVFATIGLICGAILMLTSTRGKQ